MRTLLSGLLLAAVTAAFFLLPVSCGEDTCRIEIDSPDTGDPIPVRVCATCNKGKDSQGEEAVEIDFLPNDPEVGCRCVGATCVFCIDGCDDLDCDVDEQTDEATGCTAPSISLELDEDDFAEGARIPVTIRASSRLGQTTSVVHLTRGTPTPTPTSTPTVTPSPTPTNTPGGLPLPLS